MKSKELFMLIDQIDKRFVEEAWEGDEESGKVIEVVLERSPFHAIKFAAAVAACIVLFGAGFFTIANIRTRDPFQPSSSGVSDSPGESSSSESETSSESGEISEISDVSIVDSIDEPDEFNKQGMYRLDDLYISYGDMVETNILEKTDNYDYAVIYIDETNATEEHPIVAYILSVDEYGHIKDVVSEKAYITGRGKYVFYYTTLRGAGSGCVLFLENDFKETFEEAVDIRIVGSWTP